MPQRKRIGFLVSRFPHVSETFILRELVALSGDPRLEIELMSLYPSVSDTVHPDAVPWIGKLRRPSPLAGLVALGWWALRRPFRLATLILAVIGGYARRPAMLGRALITVPIAAAHARTARSLGLEHVHAHYATWPTLCAWICWRLEGVPYSFTVHAHDIFVDQSFLRRRLDEARFVVAISEYNRRFLEHHSRSVTPIHVIHCGIDPDAYRFEPRRPPAERTVQALCVASLQEYKGHEVLLEAIAGSRRLDRIRLDLVGEGELRRRLEDRVADLGLQGRVTFHGGLREREVAELLQRAHLFVLPSTIAADGQMDGIPVALMESLACGVCTLATRLSGIPELVRDGETGFLADPGDPTSLRAALERVVEQGCEQIDAARGRELVEREFNVARSAARLAALITDAQGVRTSS